MIVLSWKLGCKVIYITLLTDQAKRQGRLASPQAKTHGHAQPVGRGPRCCCVVVSARMHAHSSAPQGPRCCCVALLARLCARPWASSASCTRLVGRSLYSRLNIFPIYLLSFRLRRITVVRYDLFVSPSLRIFAIRYTIPMQGRIV